MVIFEHLSAGASKIPIPNDFNYTNAQISETPWQITLRLFASNRLL